MKKTIIKRLFIWANVTFTPLVGAVVMSGYDKLPDALKSFLDPYAATAIAVGMVSGLLSMALSKWQGIPIEELQEWLSEKGLYAGRIDGLAGPKTQTALARAIENPDIVDYTPSKTSPPPKIIRPLGGKM